MKLSNEMSKSKNKTFKMSRLVISSIVSGGLGIVFFILGYNIYEFLGFGYALFTAIALILGIIAIIKIICTGEILKFSGITNLLILLFAGISILACFFWLMASIAHESRTYGRAFLSRYSFGSG